MESGALGRTYEPGEIIIKQGDVGNCMYVVQEGQVAIVREQDGREEFIAVRGAGEFLGEISIFEQEVQMATVRTLSQVRVLSVDKKNFLKRIHEDPSLAYRLVQSLCRRVRELSQEVALLQKRENELSEKS